MAGMTDAVAATATRCENSMSLKLVSKVQATSRASFGGHGSSDQLSDLMLRFDAKDFPNDDVLFL